MHLIAIGDEFNVNIINHADSFRLLLESLRSVKLLKNHCHRQYADTCLSYHHQTSGVTVVKITVNKYRNSYYKQSVVTG